MQGRCARARAHTSHARVQSHQLTSSLFSSDCACTLCTMAICWPVTLSVFIITVLSCVDVCYSDVSSQKKLKEICRRPGTARASDLQRRGDLVAK
eukprot:5864633-Pleurochrysis_carterae.AAC.1